MSVEDAEPLVSVVLPTRNRAHSLAAAIDSVLRQSYDTLELIVVDDGSTDGTAQVLTGYDDPRLRVLSSDARGAPAARNLGIAAARGTVIAFQDSDDRWLPDKLARQVTAMAASAPDVAVVYGMALTPGPAGGEPRTVPGHCDRERDGDLRRALLGYNIVNLPASIVRADALREAGGFDEELPRLQDWDLFLTLAEAWRFCFVDQVVVEAGEGPDRISRQTGAYPAALARILEKHSAAFARQPRAWVAYQMQLAARAARDGAPSVMVRRIAAALRHPLLVVDWALRTVTGRARVIDRDRC